MGNGILVVGGTNLEGLSVKIGNQDCANVVSSTTTSQHHCRVPALVSAVKTMIAGTRSIGSGKFEPSELTVEVGSRVDFNFEIFLDDGSYPAINLAFDQQLIMPAGTEPSNSGSGHFVFTTEGTFTVSTGFYDGVNEITGTITVTAAATSDPEVAIEVSMGDENVDLSGANHVNSGCNGGSTSPSVYKYKSSETFVYDSSTISGNTITITGYPTIAAACIGSYSISDSSCSLVESVTGTASCQLQSAGADVVYKAEVDNMIPQSTATNTVSFSQQVTGIRTYHQLTRLKKW